MQRVLPKHQTKNKKAKRKLFETGVGEPGLKTNRWFNYSLIDWGMLIQIVYQCPNSVHT